MIAWQERACSTSRNTSLPDRPRRTPGMIANLTRLLLLIQLIAAASIAWMLNHHAGVTSAGVALFLGVTIVLAVRAAITANNFRLAHQISGTLRPVCTLGSSARLLQFAQEFRATMVSSSWWMPFCRLSSAPMILSADLPVLLVHGYGCNSGFWRPLSRYLQHTGISHHAVTLEPVLGSIDDYGLQIGAAIDLLCRAAGQDRVIVVAHSMGGLVLRAYSSAHGRERIARLITLGTPHHGTTLARYGTGINGRQMCWMHHPAQRERSSWLSELHAREHADERGYLTSIYSNHDNIVAPAQSAHLDGACNIAFDGIGHVALGSDRRVIDCVIDCVIDAIHAAAEPAPRGTPDSRKPPR